MSEVVLDASALLALLNRETGHEEVARIISRAANLPVLTTDRAWEGLDLGVEVRLVRS